MSLGSQPRSLSEEPGSQTQAATKRRRQPLDPAEFWDNLSRVPLCRRALREFNRRHLPPAVPAPPLMPPVLEGRLLKSLNRFSRHGGPGLRNIRGVS
jgi:hypothetical protein